MTKDPTIPLKSTSAVLPWTWNPNDKSFEVTLTDPECRTALFHPNGSTGSAGVRATAPLLSGITYWEIYVSNRLFGTSLMFGVATANARLHSNKFVNLFGEDMHSWALSHKGFLYHNGQRIRYLPKPFSENTSTTIGVLYDSNLGTLTFFKDAISLGVAFTLKIYQPIYACVASTAARTRMTLVRIQRIEPSLQDHCRCAILKITDKIDQLPLPGPILTFLKQPMDAKMQSPNDRDQINEQF